MPLAFLIMSCKELPEEFDKIEVKISGLVRQIGSEQSLENIIQGEAILTQYENQKIENIEMKLPKSFELGDYLGKKIEARALLTKRKIFFAGPSGKFIFWYSLSGIELQYTQQ